VPGPLHSWRKKGVEAPRCLYYVISASGAIRATAGWVRKSPPFVHSTIIYWKIRSCPSDSIRASSLSRATHACSPLVLPYVRVFMCAGSKTCGRQRSTASLCPTVSVRGTLWRVCVVACRVWMLCFTHTRTHTHNNITHNIIIEERTRTHVRVCVCVCASQVPVNPVFTVFYMYAPGGTPGRGLPV
jgi:hypothetical protein